MKFDIDDVKVYNNRKFRVMVNNRIIRYGGREVNFLLGHGFIVSENNEMKIVTDIIIRTIEYHLDSDFNSGRKDLLEFGYIVEIDNDQRIVNVKSDLFSEFVKYYYVDDGKDIGIMKFNNKEISRLEGIKISNYLSSYMMVCYSECLSIFTRKLKNNRLLYRFYMLPVYSIYSIYTTSSRCIICPFLVDRSLRQFRASEIASLARDERKNVTVGGLAISYVLINKACRSLNLQPFLLLTPHLFSVLAGLFNDAFPNIRVEGTYDEESRTFDETSSIAGKSVKSIYKVARMSVNVGNTYANLLNVKLLKEGEVTYEHKTI